MPKCQECNGVSTVPGERPQLKRQPCPTCEARIESLKAKVLIWWDWELFEWFGKASDGTIVGLASDDDGLRRYLANMSAPSDW